MKIPCLNKAFFTAPEYRKSRYPMQRNQQHQTNKPILSRIYNNERTMNNRHMPILSLVSKLTPKTIVSAVFIIGVSLASQVAHADAMSEAMDFVDKYATRVETWDGPTSGPQAIADQTIVVLAGDLKNGGILGATKGMQEAAEQIGWTLRVLDGAGTVSGRSAAMGQALALKPDGIIINGFDSQEQKQGMQAAKEAGVPLVSWHAGATIGPMEQVGIFANVTTDPMLVSEAAAKWAFADAGGEPGVIIFTDSTYQIAIDKADRMKEVIEELGGTVLEYVDTPIAETSQRMPQLTTSLLQRYGAKWTHSLAINDLYFDFMGPSLAAAGIKGDGAPVNVSAGDGSESSYQRIRSGQYQQVTLACRYNREYRIRRRPEQ